jgi:hypothetical protein
MKYEKPSVHRIGTLPEITLNASRYQGADALSPYSLPNDDVPQFWNIAARRMAMSSDELLPAHPESRVDSSAIAPSTFVGASRGLST